MPSDRQTQKDSTASLRVPQIVQRAATPVVIGYWLLLFATTHLPVPDDLITADVSDKLIHFVAYFMLFLLLSMREVATRQRLLQRQTFVRLLLITFAYAITDELLQSIPILNRHCDVFDVLADWAGLLAALTIVMAIQQLYRSRRRPRNTGGE